MMNVRETAGKVAVELALAFVSASIWFVILFAVSYPVEQWLGVVAIAYVSLCAARAAIANLAVLMLVRLREYGARSLARIGAERPEPTGESRASSLVALFLLCVTVAILGLTLTIASAWTSAAGLFPLSRAFNYAGWGMLALGTTPLALFFAAAYSLFRRAEAMSKLTDRVSGIEKSESLLRRVGFHSVPIRA